MITSNVSVKIFMNSQERRGLLRSMMEVSFLITPVRICWLVARMTGVLILAGILILTHIHTTGKGRAGEEATELLDSIPGLSLTLITLPFLHSNFLGFFTPLPNEGMTQWTISACFGDHSNIDMFSATDLAYIVRKLFVCSVP